MRYDIYTYVYIYTYTVQGGPPFSIAELTRIPWLTGAYGGHTYTLVLNVEI